ncbi:MAG TPA: hypothetical protein VIJ18_15625 [Microbacteriaceae bacterium]
MSTEWTRSTEKHGIERSDAIHAVRNRVTYVRDFDKARDGSDLSADLFIGPSRDGSIQVEVLAHIDRRNKNMIVFHVMQARESTRQRAKRILAERNG